MSEFILFLLPIIGYIFLALLTYFLFNCWLVWLRFNVWIATLIPLLIILIFYLGAK